MSWTVDLQAAMGTGRLQVQIEAGPGITLLIGPNGAGKTTLMRCIAGLVRPAVGRICIGEHVLCDVGQGIWLPPERRNLGYLPQGESLFPHMSVLDNVASGLAFRGVRRGERREQARALLNDLGCSELIDRRTQHLSGGERQRIALARALVLSPRMVLLDEPLAALDVRVQQDVRGFIADRLAETGLPALWITHDARDVRQVAAEVVAIADGRMVQQGAAAELARAPADGFVAALLGE